MTNHRHYGWSTPSNSPSQPDDQNKLRGIAYPYPAESAASCSLALPIRRTSFVRMKDSRLDSEMCRASGGNVTLSANPTGSGSACPGSGTACRWRRSLARRKTTGFQPMPAPVADAGEGRIRTGDVLAQELTERENKEWYPRSATRAVPTGPPRSGVGQLVAFPQ